jgi:hypothetical protein
LLYLCSKKFRFWYVSRGGEGIPFNAISKPYFFALLLNDINREFFWNLHFDIFFLYLCITSLNKMWGDWRLTAPAQAELHLPFKKVVKILYRTVSGNEGLTTF